MFIVDGSPSAHKTQELFVLSKEIITITSSNHTQRRFINCEHYRLLNSIINAIEYCTEEFFIAFKT